LKDNPSGAVLTARFRGPGFAAVFQLLLRQLQSIAAPFRKLLAALAAGRRPEDLLATPDA
jgi:hypothetical protein